MDGTLPSYEAAMREARAYLRRRDLSSQEEIPLYFAWQRLYAAANANLSTDFLQETKQELRARQEARLAPRRGIPPPLFTSFDKVRRTSAQASAYLRTKTSSDVAIEMMARRYRREAEKLRSSREKLISSLDDADVKKTKPEQEVQVLLERFAHRGTGSDDDLPSGKSMRGKLTGIRSTDAKRIMKINPGVNNPEEDDEFGALSDDQLGTFAHKSKTRVLKPKGRLGVANSKGDFSDDFGLHDDPAKTAEWRGSSLSNVANVAAFAARVSDWRMPPDIDNEPQSTDLSRKRVKSTTARWGRLSGANELRESALVEGQEGDMTLNSSAGSSGLEDETLDLDDSPDLDTSTSSPTGRSKGVGKSSKDKATSNRDEQGANFGIRTNKSSASPDTFNVDAALARSNDVAARRSEFHQKLIQLSHAVGDMEVKIQGKQIEVTFKGALDRETESEQDGIATESSIKSSQLKQPSMARTGLDIIDNTSRERDVAGRTQGAHENDQYGEQFKTRAKGVKQSDERSTSIGGNDNSKKEQRFDGQQSDKSESDRHQFRGAAIPPAIYEGQLRQIQSSTTRASASSSASAAKTVHSGGDSEVDNTSVSRQQHRATKSQHEIEKGEDAQSISRSGEQLENHSKRASVQHKQSSVKFADSNSSDDDNYKVEERSDQQKNKIEPDQKEDGSTSGSVAAYRTQPHQVRSRSRESTSKTSSSTSKSVLEEDEGETNDASSPRQQLRFSKSQHTPLKDEDVLEHSSEGDFQSGVASTSTRVHVGADQINENEERLSERQNIRRSSAEGRLRPTKNTGLKTPSDFKADRPRTEGDTRQDPSHVKTHSSGRDAVDSKIDSSVHDQTIAATNARTNPSGRITTRDERTRRNQDMSAAENKTEPSGRGQNVTTRDEKNNSSGRDQKTTTGDDRTKFSRSDKNLSAKVDRVYSSGLQNVAATDSRADDHMGTDKSSVNTPAEQQSKLSHGDQQFHGGVDNDNRTNDHSTAKPESNIRSTQYDISYDAQSFSDASEDDIDDDDQEVSFADEPVLSTSKNSSRSSTKQVPQTSSGEISSRERSRDLVETLDYERNQQPSSRLRRSQPALSDLDSDDESDDDFSDGPDTPNVKQHLRKHTKRELSRVSHDLEAQKRSKRSSSQSNVTRHHGKRNNYTSESDSANNKSDESSTDNDSRYEDQSSHTRHRSHNADRSQRRHSKRTQEFHSRSKKYYAREHDSRDVYFPFSLDLPPKEIKPTTRPKRNSKTWSDLRCKKPYKIPEDIVWPPGMEEECIARLGLNGHHPIAPPGLEHLVTEEQWGDYWTWLHWYSSWQMWYMKNGKTPKRKSGKEKRSERPRANMDEYPDIKYAKHGSRSANWWVDIGSRKRQHRHRRARNTE